MKKYIPIIIITVITVILVTIISKMLGVEGASGIIGGVVGGVIGRVFGCFLPNTLVSMSDGSKKKIIDIELKDNVAIGGFVFATGKFLVNDIYDYKGIKVSGSHLVNEKGNWFCEFTKK